MYYYLDIAAGADKNIQVYEGENLKENFIIVLTENKTRINLTNYTCNLAYSDLNNAEQGEELKSLKFNNAEQGEILLEINKDLTKRPGNYVMQLEVLDNTGHIQYTATFGYIVKKNVFNSIANGIKASTPYQDINNLLVEVKTLDTNLKDKIDQYNSVLANLETQNNTATDNIAVLETNFNNAKNINIDLENKSNKAAELNKTLTANVNSVDSKNNMLKDSLKAAEDFSKTLKNGTDFVQMRKDIDTLENNLKDTQSLSYAGSNITCNNSLEGRTSNLRLYGSTLQNVIKIPSIDNYGITTAGTSITMTGNGGYPTLKYDTSLFKTNTKYTLFVDVKELNNIDNTAWCLFRIGQGDGKVNTIVPNPTSIGLYKVVFTTPAAISVADTFMRPNSNKITVKLDNLMIIEGDLTNKDIDYFEGIQGVGDQEVNLCEYMGLGGVIYAGGTDYVNNSYCRTSYIPVTKGETYCVSRLGIPNIEESLTIYYYDKDKKWIDGLNTAIAEKYNYFTAKATGYVRIEHKMLDGSVLDPTVISNIKRQVNKGQILFPYTEPFRVPIKYISCNENLFKYKITDFTGSNLNNFKIENNVLSFSNSKKFSSTNSLDISYLAGKTVIISARAKNGRIICSNVIYKGQLNGIMDTTTAGDTEGIISRTFTITKDTQLRLETPYDNKEVSFKEIMINEGEDIKPYIDHKEDIKKILLPKGCSFNDLDTIEETSKGVIYTQRIGKIILNGTENWNLANATHKNTILFQRDTDNNMKAEGVTISDKFNYDTPDHQWANDYECCCVNLPKQLGIRINKSRLETQDTAGFKKWLKANPVIAYYELAEPKTYLLQGIEETDIDTYNIITYVKSLNTIPAAIDFSISTNYGSLLMQHSQEINKIWDTIYNIVYPVITENAVEISKAQAKNLLN